ncbi:Alpha-2-macroglobulin RAP protein [Cooperia oncophora]
MDTKSVHKSRSAQEYTSQMEKIDKKLVALLEKYDLQQAVHAFKEKMKHKNEPSRGADHLKVSELEEFDDERLQQLWETAKNGKFSDTELIALHGELKDAERKTRMYGDALQEMNKVPMENSIHFDEHESLDSKKAQLKKIHRDMSDHIDQLHQKINEDNKSPFENDRVRRLWKTAQMNGNFSQKDLDIMKDELLHFDVQLKKIAFHKKELDARREERQKQGKMTLHAVEDVELEAKHEKMERKLRKLEKYLDSKVRHSEL